MSREILAGIHKARQRKSEKQAEISELSLHEKAAAQKTLASANRKDMPLAFCNRNFRVLLDSKQNPQVHFRRLGDFGPSGETRTRGILVPNQAPYQLGHTRIAQTSLRNENIIHESPEKATPKTDGCRQKFGKAMEPM